MRTAYCMKSVTISIDLKDFYFERIDTREKVKKLLTKSQVNIEKVSDSMFNICQTPCNYRCVVEDDVTRF